MPSSGPEDDIAGRVLGGLRQHEKVSPADPAISRLEESLPVPSIPRYEILGILGEGATSVVYRATDRELGRPVALKVIRDPLSSDPAARERFQREARVTAGLS